MKLERLDSTTQRHSRDAVERVRHADDETIRRVDALEGIESDRRRSLQQEINEYDARLIAPFEGREMVLEDARRVAAQLTLLGRNLNGLVRLRALSQPLASIDDKV